MPISLRYSHVVAGRGWGRLAIRMGVQDNTQLLSWNRVHLDLLLQDGRAAALFFPSISCHFP